MHILILGAGAMGSLIGARLSETGEPVTLLSTDREHMRTVRKSGLQVEELDGSVRNYVLPSYDSARGVPDKADLILVTVKSYDTQKAVSSVTDCCCHDSTLFLTLQNGTGNWERIAEIVGKGPVLAGITAQGATLVAPGRVRHGGNGPTFIGERFGPPTPRVEAVVDVFRRSPLTVSASDQMERMIWEKLMVNVGINAITALTAGRNGIIADIEPARGLCRSAVEEAMSVARAMGVLVREDMVDHVLSVARATAVNRSSMGQDVDQRKSTEIDAINGAIVGLGEQVRLPTPVNRALTQLIKTLEASFSSTK